MTSKQAEQVPSAALVQLVHAARGRLSPRQRAEGVHLFVALWDRRRANTKVGRWLWVGAPVGLSALVLLASMMGFERHRSAILSCAVDGGHVAPGGAVEADSTAPPRLRFSDGSEVLLAGGTRAFVRSMDSHGARVSLVEGGAHVDIAHVPGAHWLVDAGPFLITVTGTAFSVAWHPAEEQLDVQMERGTVGVSGPLSDGAIPLRSGQHLIVRVRQRETVVRDLADESGAAAPVPPPLSDPAAANGPVSPASSRAGAAVGLRVPAHGSEAAGGESWPAQLARGNFAAVVRQAEQKGLETCLADASSEDLAALADAARYVRRGDVARRALLTQRRRYPLSTPAHDACFLLGRLEEADQNASTAIEWYDRYLSESPSGTYASEALGRKMDLTGRVYSNEQARAVADEYLRRFPQGMYAARAHALRRAP